MMSQLKALVIVIDPVVFNESRVRKISMWASDVSGGDDVCTCVAMPVVVVGGRGVMCVCEIGRAHV